MNRIFETKQGRREFIKTLGLGVGALTLGDPRWLFAQTTKTITVGSASRARPIYGLALYSASERILKPELGIALQEKTFKGFVPSFAAMVRGDVDLSYQTLPALTRAIKEKFAVKGFLGYVEQFVFYMVARSDIKSLDELVSIIKKRARSGKKLKIASHSPTSQAHIAIIMILREKGIDPKKDVEIVFLSGTPRRLAALKAKNIDATVISTSRAIDKAIKGEITILAKMSDYAPNQSVIIWVAGEETLAKRSKDVLDVTKSLIRSYREMYTRDLKELAEFAAKQKPYSKFSQPETLLETLKAAREMKLWPADGGITDERIKAAQKFLVESGNMKPENVLPIDQLITPKFRDQALKELGPA
jgi:NitT/TauT family transport system substrate-binding protein